MSNPSQVTFTSREFNQDTARAKREAANGPVFITDRGEPAFVLMSVAQYQRMAPPKDMKSWLAALYDEEAAAIEFELPPRVIEQFRPIDLS